MQAEMGDSAAEQETSLANFSAAMNVVTEKNENSAEEAELEGHTRKKAKLDQQGESSADLENNVRRSDGAQSRVTGAESVLQTLGLKPKESHNGNGTSFSSSDSPDQSSQLQMLAQFQQLQQLYQLQQLQQQQQFLSMSNSGTPTSGVPVDQNMLLNLIRSLTPEVPLKIALHPGSVVFKPIAGFHELGFMGFGIEVSDADLTPNENVIIRLARSNSNESTLQEFQHMLTSASSFEFECTSSTTKVFRNALGCYVGRRLYTQLHVDPNVSDFDENVELYFGVRVGNSDEVFSLPFQVNASEIDLTWINSRTDAGAKLLKSLVDAHKEQMHSVERSFLSGQQTAANAIRHGLANLKPSIEAAETSGAPIALASSSEKVSPLATLTASLGLGSSSFSPRPPALDLSQNATASSGVLGAQILLSQLNAGSNLSPGGFTSGTLGSPGSQDYEAILKTLKQVSDFNQAMSLAKSVSPQGLKSSSSSPKRKRKKAPGSPKMPLVRSVTLSRDAEQKLFLYVNDLRVKDRPPENAHDERHLQMFTWNENMALLLCAALQESSKNPFKAILREFNRPIAENPHFDNPFKRPLRDRSSLRKRLQKIIRGDHMSKEWERTRRSAAAVFVASSRQRASEMPAEYGYLKDAADIVTQFFIEIDPNTPPLVLSTTC